MTSLICLIIGHKFSKFYITEWGIPYNTGYIKRFDFCQRCTKPAPTTKPSDKDASQ